MTVEVYFHTDRSKLVLEFYHTGDQKSYWEAIWRRSSVTDYPVLSNGLQWVKCVLEECLGRHPSCAITHEPLLPKRTLYLKRLNNGDVCVKLCEHKNKRGRYIALSHCWGSSPTCTTTPENIKEYQQGVPWEALPTTFRDAITFTLALEVHHLWIDSLCIIQKDTKDWEVESSKMANVYENAYLTLAATASNNGSEGCFSAKRKLAKEVQLYPKNEDHSVMVRELANSVYGCLNARLPVAYTWLGLARTELVRECLGNLTCECGGILADCEPLERLHIFERTASKSNAEMAFGRYCRRFRIWVHPKKKLSSLIERTKRRRTKRLSQNPLVSDLDHLDGPKHLIHSQEKPIVVEKAPSYLEYVSDQWHNIVEQYTSLKLSKETDRLPALSGLATRASSILGTYSCGLWLNTITSDLLWRVPLLELRYGRPIKYTGPSWSWASVDGPVAYWNDLDNQFEDDSIDALRHNIHTLETWFERNEARQALQWRLQEQAANRQRPLDLQTECYITLAGENPFGEVTSSRLRIRGYTCHAKLLYVNQYGSAKSIHVDTHDPLRYQLRIRARDSRKCSSNTWYTLELPFFADYVLSSGPYAVLENDELTLLQIHQNVCLVLRCTRIDGEYQRVGIVRPSSGYLTLYELDWMSGSSQHVVTIV
ncbi:heterokaryon incompatibility protein-domain-containing protein [Xylogone sp. PMI_703]|nr:heterokaryon incompatibility protein-domain-containing protein [Xylogone sp. PMI_703]